MIIVVEGAIEQWVERDRSVLSAGRLRATSPPTSCTRSFNDGRRAGAASWRSSRPAVGEDGYGVEDVSGDEPWASLR